MHSEIGCIVFLYFTATAADKRKIIQIIFAEKQNDWRRVKWSRQAKKHIKTETLF